MHPLGSLAIVFLVGGNALVSPTGQYVGLMLFGAGFALGGIDGVVTRRFGLARPFGERGAAYSSMGAVLMGIVFALLGAWIMVFARTLLAGSQRAFLEHLARRPGIAFLSVGTYLLGFAGATLIGSPQLNEGSRWDVLSNLVVYRFLPGLILVVLGLAALGVGLLEIAAPAAFDEIGGGLLEVWFSIDQ